jgi:hypothetical protein
VTVQVKIERIATGAAADAYASLKAVYSGLRAVDLHAIPVQRFEDIQIDCFIIEWRLQWGPDIVQRVTVRCTEDYLDAGEEWLQGRLTELIVQQAVGESNVHGVLGRA